GLIATEEPVGSALVALVGFTKDLDGDAAHIRGADGRDLILKRHIRDPLNPLRMGMPDIPPDTSDAVGEILLGVLHLPEQRIAVGGVGWIARDPSAHENERNKN